MKRNKASSSHTILIVRVVTFVRSADTIRYVDTIKLAYRRLIEVS